MDRAAGPVASERAWAKINLGLKVLGRRTDGYHEIRSIMQCVDLADELHFWPADETHLSCTDPQLPTGPENLVRRAAAAFHERLGGGRQAYRIHLEKNIPLGAGLGGGSADAAAVLRALNGLAGHPLDAAGLRSLAEVLGSDVPFLVEGGTALVRGRGEILEPLVWSGEVWYLLAYPGVGVSTAWAYRQIRPGLTPASPYLSLLASYSGGRVEGTALFPVLENDFQAIVERANPIVAELRSRIEQSGAQACSMSGSGSTLYGIFFDRDAAFRAHQGLEARGFRSFVCRPV